MTITNENAGVQYPESMIVDLVNFPRYKSGANYSDVSKIKKYTGMGYTPFQIAHMIGVVQSCVESHIKGPRKKPGPKPRADIQ
jgi:hypothetical protein